MNETPGLTGSGDVRPPMSRHLLECSFQLKACNRTASNTQPFVTQLAPHSGL